MASQVENVRELQKTKKKRQLSVDSIFTLYIQIAREQMKRKPIIAVTTSLAIETHTNRKSPSCSTPLNFNVPQNTTINIKEEQMQTRTHTDTHISSFRMHDENNNIISLVKRHN